jgi:hypothetical protein
MSTRATIKFSDGEDIFVYRGHDGMPDSILPDIKEVIEKAKGRWSEPMGCLLATMLVGMNFDIDKRFPIYEITSGFHGDESYKYFVTWNDAISEWVITHSDIGHW